MSKMQHYNFCLSRQDAALFQDKPFPDTSAYPPLPTEVADHSTRTMTMVHHMYTTTHGCDADGDIW